MGNREEEHFLLADEDQSESSAGCGIMSSSKAEKRPEPLCPGQTLLPTRGLGVGQVQNKPEVRYAPAPRGVTPARWQRAAGRRGGTGFGMAEVELESDQIRLKCIRKEGFFTVPPEHRVRRGATRAAPRGRARPKRSGALRGAFKFEFAAAGARRKPQPTGWGRGGTEGVRPRVGRVGGSGGTCRRGFSPRVTHIPVSSLLCDAEGEP